MDALAGRIERLGNHWYGLFLLLAVPTFLVFSPLLIGGQVVAWDDGVIQTAPYLASYSGALHSGGTPLWEPAIAFGYPLFATSFGFFTPWNYAFASAIADPFTFAELLPWLIFLVFSLGAFFCVKLLREFGVSFWAAYIGGIAYLMGQRFDLLLPITVNAALFLPLLFYVIWMIRKTGSWWYAAAGVGTLAFGFLAVNFQEALYSILASLCFATFLIFYRSSTHFTVRARNKFILCLAVVYIAGGLIGMVQLLPPGLFASVSTRTTGVTYQEAAEDPVLPTDFLRYVIPEARLPLGIPFGSSGSDAPFYIGVIPLFFFVIGFFAWSPINRFFKWLWLGALSIAIVYSPLFWLTTKLPIFSNFRVPARWMVLAYFATAIIVAFGVDQSIRWSNEEGTQRLRRVFTWFLAVTATVLLGLLLLNVVFLFGQEIRAFLKSFFAAHLYARYQPLGTHPVGEYFAIIDHYFTDLQKTFALTQPIIQGALASFVAGAGYLWFLVSRKQPLSRRALCTLALLAVAAFLLVKPFTYETMSASTLRAIPPTVTFLKDHSGRVLSHAHEAYEEEVVVPNYHPSLEERFQYRAATLVPNLNLYYGIPSALIKDGLQILPVARLLSLVSLPTVPVGVEHAFPAQGKDPQETLALRKQLLDFLGIKYILSGFPLDEKVFPKVFETTLTSKNIPIAIYENKEARPILYFINSAEFVRGSREEILDLYLQDFSHMLLSCEEPCVPREASFTRGAVQSLEEKNGLLKADVTAKAPGFLVFSENDFPGWQAFVDGKEVPIHTVNSVFMGIEVPVGKHAISFAFSNFCATASGLPTCLGALLKR